MAYVKQGFKDGDKLTASQLEAMEDGIKDVEKKVEENAGGVSSWNDLTDKPFYEEVTVGELLPETQAIFIEDEGMFLVTETLPLEIGSVYTVNWNGTEYTCVCVEFDAMPVIGNIDSMNGAGDTGEPFVVIPVPPEVEGSAGVSGTMIIPLDGSIELTLSVSGEVKTVHALEKKYLPELRGQKKIVLDISTMTSNVPINKVLQMDLAEIKSSIVITDGTYEVYDVVSIWKETVEYNGATYEWLILTVSEKKEEEGIRFKRIQWIEAFTLEWYGDEYTTIPVQTFEGNEKNMLLGVYYGSGSGYGTRWLPFTKIGFDSIVLKSTDSSKYFRITVNDSGTITATKIEDNEQIL